LVPLFFFLVAAPAHFFFFCGSLKCFLAAFVSSVGVCGFLSFLPFFSFSNFCGIRTFCILALSTSSPLPPPCIPGHLCSQGQWLLFLEDCYFFYPGRKSACFPIGAFFLLRFAGAFSHLFIGRLYIPLVGVFLFWSDKIDSCVGPISLTPTIHFFLFFRWPARFFFGRVR